MDEFRPAALRSTTLHPARLRVSEHVPVQAGTTFTVVTDATDSDPISKGLASGRFPAATRTAVEYLQEMTPKGGRILDLGTRVGSFTLAAAALGYEVVGVEASPRYLELLRASLDRNGFDRVRLIHAAVNDTQGTIQITPNGPDRSPGTSAESEPVVSVPAMRVDDIMAAVGWDRVDFVKISVEGSEVAALRGMSRLLYGAKAAPLFVESNGYALHTHDQTPLRLKAELDALGYRIYLVQMGRLCPVRVQDFQPETRVDLLAVKQPLRNPRLCRLDQALSDGEILHRTLQSARSPEVQDRVYVARALGQAPANLLSSKEVHDAVESLLRDPSPDVRSIAAAVRLLPTRRSWFFRWHPGAQGVPRPHVLHARTGQTLRSRSGRS